LWPFTDLTDPRLYLGAGFITLRQDAARGPFKIGLTHGLPWVAYWLNGVLFVKRWTYDFGAAYPDEGSNCELFTNQNMLEVESLGPLELLEPGQSCELVEEWFVFEGIAAFDARNQASINAAIGEAVNSLPG
jgi:hypothetical protein